MRKKLLASLIIASSLTIAGCAGGGGYSYNLAPPEQLTAPMPAQGNSGEYMSPYTSDGVLAEWVNNSVNAEMGSAIGGMAGAYAGQKLAENVPFIGGWLGQAAGESLGREVALEAAGGEEVIRDTSDVSFNSLQELAVWMYVNHSSHPHYQDALDSAMSVYPELKQIYSSALYTASAQAGY